MPIQECGIERTRCRLCPFHYLLFLYFVQQLVCSVRNPMSKCPPAEQAGPESRRWPAAGTAQTGSWAGTSAGCTCWC